MADATGTEHGADTHQHPTVTISATDVDPGTKGIQVNDSDTDTTDLILKFDVTITMQPTTELTLVSGTNASTFDYQDNDPGISINGGAPDYNILSTVSSVVLGDGTYTAGTATAAPKWEGTVTVTLNDDTVGTTTNAQQVAAALDVGIPIPVEVAANKIQAAVQTGPYYDSGNDVAYQNLATTLDVNMVSADTTKPTLMITHDPADGVALPGSKLLTFTFKFSEAPATTGDGMFTAADVMVTNATKGDLSGPTAGTGDDAGKTIYMLPVTVTNIFSNVMVTVEASDVTDMVGNSLAANASATYMAPNSAPSVQSPANIKAVVGREMVAENVSDRATIGTSVTGLALERAIDDDHDIITYELVPTLADVDLKFTQNRQGDQTLHGDMLTDKDPSPQDLIPSKVYAPTNTFNDDVEYIARDGNEGGRGGLQDSQRAEFNVHIKAPDPTG